MTWAHSSIAAVQSIFYGMIIVSVWDAVVQHSLNPLRLGTLFPMFLQLLRAELIRVFLVSIAVGPIFGLSAAAFVLYRAGFTANNDAYEAQAKSFVTFANMPQARRLNKVIPLAACSAAMLGGIYAIIWWNGGSIDAVTADAQCSFILVFIGSCIYLVSLRDPRETRQVGLIGDEQTRLTQTQEAHKGRNEV